jgi:SAM-dependent methyltransferase
MDTEAWRRQNGLSFGPAAELYDRIRPTYPAEVVTWMLGRAPRRVVDIGAGTGIFSRVVAGLGHEVLAVEPDEAMRGKLAAASPDITALAGTAESIPLPDESVDAAVAAQAYHWFTPETAHPEIARVIRLGGVFAAVWNVRDESVPWVAEMSSLVGGSEAAGLVRTRDIDLAPHFGSVERHEMRHATRHTADSLVALVASRSYYLVAGPDQRRQLEADVRALVADLPEVFELPYITVAFRSIRR